VQRLPTIAEVAEVLALSPPEQPWSHEAPLRALIRSNLCREGEKWWRADRVAFVLVARGRNEIGVRAPVGGDSDAAHLEEWLGRECVVCDRLFRPRRLDHLCCSRACYDRKCAIEARPVHLRRCRDLRNATVLLHPLQA
jgi:hypothetical protein